MKKISAYFLAIFPSVFISCKEPPEIEWQHVYGGDEDDFLVDVIETSDGGYVVAGSSSSGINGDRTDPNRGIWSDYWIVKTDANGNKEWDKAFGGNYLEYLYSISQTSDGGYLLGGLSYSGKGQDKEEGKSGDCDIWVVKTNANFKKQWDSTFGGDKSDELGDVIASHKGGFIFCGSLQENLQDSLSGIYYRESNFWIFETNEYGAITRQAVYDGPAAERCEMIEKMEDGGFILCGTTRSYVSNNTSRSPYGNADYWIIKIDSNWNKQWEARFGGPQDDYLTSTCKTSDGGLIVAGTSNFRGLDNVEGSANTADYWVVKIDKYGNKLWNRSYGGDAADYLYSIAPLADGGLILGGASKSGKGEAKSNPAFGGYDIWLIRTDQNGNSLWDRTIGGYGDDGGTSTGSPMRILPTKDGGFIVGCSTNSGISGLKTKPARGGTDYWVIKLKPEKNRRWYL